MDWKAIRSEFPAVEGQVWLNTATYGPGPRPVLEATQGQILSCRVEAVSAETAGETTGGDA